MESPVLQGLLLLISLLTGLYAVVRLIVDLVKEPKQVQNWTMLITYIVFVVALGAAYVVELRKDVTPEKVAEIERGTARKWAGKIVADAAMELDQVRFMVDQDFEFNVPSCVQLASLFEHVQNDLRRDMITLRSVTLPSLPQDCLTNLQVFADRLRTQLIQPLRTATPNSDFNELQSDVSKKARELLDDMDAESDALRKGG